MRILKYRSVSNHHNFTSKDTKSAAIAFDGNIFKLRQDTQKEDVLRKLSAI